MASISGCKRSWNCRVKGDQDDPVLSGGAYQMEIRDLLMTNENTGVYPRLGKGTHFWDPSPSGVGPDPEQSIGYLLHVEIGSCYRLVE